MVSEDCTLITKRRPVVKEKITPHLQRKIRDGSNAIARQFQIQSDLSRNIDPNDPLGEETLFSPVI